MDFFGRPNIAKMASENDRDGLYQCLKHRSPITRLEAAQALANLNDGTGWRFLTETVEQESDPDVQEAAIAILAELGSRGPADARRAVPPLARLIKTARGDLAETLRDALEQIGGPDAEEALRQANFLPAPDGETEVVTDFDAHFIRPILSQPAQFEFLTSEQHLNNAVDLREAEHAERGLVEGSLALWLKPDWGYAWYLRGVLFEDLDRPYEAWLAYNQAQIFDPASQEVREALDELENEHHFLPPEQQTLLRDLDLRSWQRRRDASAGLGELPPGEARQAVDLLIDLLDDDEREVRMAAIHSLGLIGDPRAIFPLMSLNESSWLMRFTVLEALSNLGSVDGLMNVLHKEMNLIQERNPVFSSNRDPLVEVEYDRLMEIGALALERTGQVENLLAIAEDNAWEEVDYEDEPALGENDDVLGLEEIELFDEAEDEGEADEDLADYVDEAALMAVVALERSALARMETLSPALLRRLADVPDLTLLDVSDESASEPEPVVVHDLSKLRSAAQKELARRV